MSNQSRIGMSEVILLAIVALLVQHAACAGTAFADEPTVVLPPNSTCSSGSGDRTVSWPMGENRFCTTPDKARRANAAHAAKDACEQKLGEVLNDNRNLLAAERHPAWWTALKWGSVGAAIGGAFVAGALLF